MFELTLWLDGLAVIAVFAALGWLLSLPLRNVSIVDSMWSLMFLLAALTYTAAQASPGPRAWLVVTLVGLWSIRLAAYISWRNRGHGERQSTDESGPLGQPRRAADWHERIPGEHSDLARRAGKRYRAAS